MFEYFEELDIAALSWCSIIGENLKSIKVIHGSGVEVFNDFFVEGVWDAPFEKGDFDKSTYFMGSGGKLLPEEENKVLFSSASHTLERLYTIEHNNNIYISNSLPLILKVSNIKLDSNYREYQTDFSTIQKGINNYKKNIPLENNLKLKLHYYCNIKIDSSLKIEVVDKPGVKPFIDYSDYKKRLKESIKQIVMNANSSIRNKKYGLVSTISKGYDASACAALAKEVGCDIAVTFDRPSKYAADSGEDIAKKLGYKKTIKKNANSYLENDSLLETDFLSSGEPGTGIVFSAFEKEFKNNLVFMGLGGDRIWEKNDDDPNNEFRFKDTSVGGQSIIENRLRADYIVIHIPFFGASQWKSISAISNSTEMEEYSIGGDYDRPIPRRILEENGVPRSMFGKDKVGAGINYSYDNLSRIEKRMSSNSFESFQKFYKNNKVFNIAVLKNWFSYLWFSKNEYTNYLLSKINSSFRFSEASYNSVSNPGAVSYLFPWAINIAVSNLNIKKINKQ